MTELFDRLANEKVVAIIRGIPDEAGDKTAEALAEGGIVFLEVTMNTPSALSMITRFRKRYEGRLRIGAGTVLNEQMAREAVNAGAEYLISPNLDESMVRYGQGQGLEVWPGTMTPTEMVRAHQLGVSAVKVFPMGSLGLSYLKEIRAPLSHIPMMVTGGVNLDNIAEFLKSGAFAVGIGGNLVSKQLIANGDFKQMEQVAREFVSRAKGATTA